jgi:hypothetical protein
MKTGAALSSGLAGASALTLLHEVVRRVNPDAPRMDLLGMQAIAKLIKGAGETPPKADTLHTWALAGDLVSNALYYSLTGLGKSKQPLLRGSLLGLGAGLGAVLLPKSLGLDEEASNRTPATQAMTVAWYVVGGLAAAAVFRWLKSRN